MTIESLAHAKINLNLHILPRSPSGEYTPLSLINHQIGIFDRLTYIKQKRDIDLEYLIPGDLPPKDDNLVYRAAELLKKTTGNSELGARIILEKNIPITAGLAGGSTDAANTIVNLVKLWDLKLSKQQIFEIANSLGKDVPYFLIGGLCQLSEFGNVVSKINMKFPHFDLLIVYPNDSNKPSTKWMFQHLDFSLLGKNLFKVDQLLDGIKNGNKDQILANLHNDFEPLAFNSFPEIKKIISDLEGSDSDATSMAGAGLTIIGYFKSLEKCQAAFHRLSEKYSKIFLTETK